MQVVGMLSLTLYLVMTDHLRTACPSLPDLPPPLSFPPDVDSFRLRSSVQWPSTVPPEDTNEDMGLCTQTLLAQLVSASEYYSEQICCSDSQRNGVLI